MSLLRVENLCTYFETEGHGRVKAVDGVNLCLDRGSAEGLVGESGCGKTVTALSIMRLLPPKARVADGRILFEGRDLLQLSPAETQKIRGNRIAMVFQDPLSSLNPSLTVGEQVAETIRLHQGLRRFDAHKRAVSMLELVQLPSPSRRMREYPYQLSGGMRQRVMIAMALSCSPDLLIADEPTTALDVTIQAQILELIRELTVELDTALLLITHDLGIVAELCHQVSVMYAGRVVEKAPTRNIFKSPQHPYSRGLLDSIPRVDREVDYLQSIPGSAPDLGHLPPGCSFHPRCRERREICSREEPAQTEIRPGQTVSCWLHAGKSRLTG